MDNTKTISHMALLSIPIAIVIFVFKYCAWYLTGSVALYSDALESIVNVIGACAAWWAIRVSMKPADKNHPFGHYKAEYFSAVLEGVLIIVAALLILNEAWSALRNPHIIEHPDMGLALNLLAAVFNALWAFMLIRYGRRHRSPALEADGQHIMTDVVTSVGVLFGLVAALITGWAVLDPLLAIIVALNILWQGWKVINSSVQGLMDTAVDAEENTRIHDVIAANAKGAIEAHDLRTRLAGRVTFIEFHLVVPANMTVGKAHKICDRIEDALQKDIKNSRVVIHIEPENEARGAPDTTDFSFT
ncbi:MAG: Cation diffusion facilitator family transporter [Candidatus Tokpelaia hoelldobleri]|uniref:Protein p34 n=1 Tax=Candidatus Tokpelaia hoelldobleri TaxID=1902579 RepID=A0A1U9JTJ0_9HYPH|nr:MAG: Cation diffusion facilitator family transporter [Candidatus Tokpelaia hoelldoblerii]